MLNRPVALVIAHSAQLRESLLVLLRAIPQIETIHPTEYGPEPLALTPKIQPTLVLLDCDLSDDELQTTLGQIKGRWPQAQCVVFVDNEQERRHVEDAGADVVLIKGMRAAAVLETIEGLLSENV